jgi:putative transcriptional regulator
MTKRKYRSDIAKAVHEGVRGMRRLGLVGKQTMREFDLRCLTAVEAMRAKA